MFVTSCLSHRITFLLFCIYDENKDFKSNTAYEDEDIKISHLLRGIMWFASMFYAETRSNITMLLPLQTLITILGIPIYLELASIRVSYKTLYSRLVLHICNIWDEKKNDFTSQSPYAYTQCSKVLYKTAKQHAEKINVHGLDFTQKNYKYNYI